MNTHIIIAEDDESIRRLLEVSLAGHGYTPLGFGSAEDALAEMERTAPALVIFDIMMDGIGGIEAVRRMRASETLRHIPVIMLTARDTELDKIVGLDAGADDYITKPFSVLELCARVRARLRRVEEKREASALILNAATREAHLAGTPLELTFKEFELLKLLMDNSDRAMHRDALLARVWGGDYYGETRTLDIHIATLRGKLRDLAPDTSYIKTVRGIGYRFVGGAR
ncbi:MAG: response regulator transcription factor [Oscillospiraceae bacterium]|nr:response regulator transcription factor [Oscillospiraceae bacterium]